MFESGLLSPSVSIAEQVDPIAGGEDRDHVLAAATSSLCTTTQFSLPWAALGLAC
jgi:hypothetical protein